MTLAVREFGEAGLEEDRTNRVVIIVRYTPKAKLRDGLEVFRNVKLGPCLQSGETVTRLGIADRCQFSFCFVPKVQADSAQTVPDGQALGFGKLCVIADHFG